MSESKNRDKRRIEDDEKPIWIKVQIALANEDVFSQGSGVPDYSESYSKIFSNRSVRSRFNNLRKDKLLYRDYILSYHNLLSESAINDLVDAQTDIFFLRLRTPELDEISWSFSKLLLSHRECLRSVGINLPIENDHRIITQAEMAIRTSYLHKIWHNSLYTMSELGMEIPNWCKILPYRPLVNAFHGTNQDDEDMGEKLLSVLEEKYPELHNELIASNPFHSPLIGFTPGKGHRRGTKFPSIFDIISRLESGESVNQDWENKLLEHLPLSEIIEDSDEIEENDESLIDLYRKLPITALRREADRMELTSVWSMDREKLISALEIRVREMDKIGFQYPTIPRLTDWTIFIISNLDFLQAKICFCVSGGEELLSTSQKGYFRGVCGDGENCY